MYEGGSLAHATYATTGTMKCAALGVAFPEAAHSTEVLPE